MLVVDDEAVVRMLVNGRAGRIWATHSAGTPPMDADRRPRKSCKPRSRIDLLVTDVGLPGGLNGRQLAEAARQRRPGLKVLFITGYAEDAVIGSGKLEPGMHVMATPFVMKTLAGRITAIIGHEPADTRAI